MLNFHWPLTNSFGDNTGQIYIGQKMRRSIRKKIELNWVTNTTEEIQNSRPQEEHRDTAWVFVFKKKLWKSLRSKYEPLRSTASAARSLPKVWFGTTTTLSLRLLSLLVRCTPVGLHCKFLVYSIALLVGFGLPTWHLWNFRQQKVNVDMGWCTTKGHSHDLFLETNLSIHLFLLHKPHFIMAHFEDLKLYWYLKVSLM